MTREQTRQALALYSRLRGEGVPGMMTAAEAHRLVEREFSPLTPPARWKPTDYLTPVSLASVCRWVVRQIGGSVVLRSVHTQERGGEPDA